MFFFRMAIAAPGGCFLLAAIAKVYRNSQELLSWLVQQQYCVASKLPLQTERLLNEAC